MKTPACRFCENGVVTLPSHLCSRPTPTTCWICGGTNFKGMSKIQVVWYKAQTKALEAAKKDLFSNGEFTDMMSFVTVKTHINKACTKLGIAQTAPVMGLIEYKKTEGYARLKAEIYELERRLRAIPVAATTKMHVAA